MCATKEREATPAYPSIPIKMGSLFTLLSGNLINLEGEGLWLVTINESNAKYAYIYDIQNLK